MWNALASCLPSPPLQPATSEPRMTAPRSQWDRITRRAYANLVCVLRDPPTHPGWIAQGEVAHSPRLLDHVGDGHAVGGDEAGVVDLAPPRVDVLDEQVDGQLSGVRLVEVVLLEQERGVADVEVGDAPTVGREVEAQVLIELFGPREVLGGHERF